VRRSAYCPSNGRGAEPNLHGTPRMLSIAGPGCYARPLDELSFSCVIVFGVDMRVTNVSGGSTLGAQNGGDGQQELLCLGQETSGGLGRS
jgi:hypothetical protein